MADGVDMLKQGYEAFAKGDLDEATENWSDDFVWQGVDAEGLPGSGTHEGKDEAKQVLAKSAEPWESISYKPDEFIDGGETVVVLGHAEGTPKEGDGSVKVPFAHVWRIEDEQLSRIQVLTDTAVIRDAIGGSGSSGSSGSGSSEGSGSSRSGEGGEGSGEDGEDGES